MHFNHASLQLCFCQMCIPQMGLELRFTEREAERTKTKPCIAEVCTKGTDPESAGGLHTVHANW